MPALQKKHKKSSVHNIKSVMNTRYGAGGGARTRTVLPPRDFKSLASACFATPAYPPYRTTGGTSLSRAGSAARGDEKSPPAAADNQHAPLASARIF